MIYGYGEDFGPKSWLFGSYRKYSSYNTKSIYKHEDRNAHLHWDKENNWKVIRCEVMK